MKEEITRIFQASIEAKADFLRTQSSELLAATNTVIRMLRAGGKILLFGNGGSAGILPALSLQAGSPHSQGEKPALLDSSRPAPDKRCRKAPTA